MTEAERPAVVRLEGVHKRFREYDRLKGTGSLKTSFVDLLRGRRRDPSSRRRVLTNVDLEVRAGDCVALLGPNGSGKSTLLKLVAGIYLPDHGRVMTRGRIASLLELGTGFHPDFTGRENVFVNGAILGLDAAEIEARLPEIVEFSGLADALDAPVRTYSSGMYVRLGFSVAIHVRPEILLVDEVLAVGDSGFREKCLAKISELQAEGTTILFVTHDMKLVRKLAMRAVTILEGGVHEPGDVESAVALYDGAAQEREERAAHAYGGEV